MHTGNYGGGISTESGEEGRRECKEEAIVKPGLFEQNWSITWYSLPSAVIVLVVIVPNSK
jgi:hypothetical protein